MDTGFKVPSALKRPFPLYMSVVLSELGKAPFVAYWIVLSNSGTVNTYLFRKILSDNLVENWAACFRIYRINESLIHIPMILIVSVDTLSRYTAILSPERRDCAPVYMGPKPNRILPRICTSARNFAQIPAEVIVNLFSFVSMKVLTWIF